MMPEIRRLIAILKGGGEYFQMLDDLYNAKAASEGIVMKCHRVCDACDCGDVSVLAQDAERAAKYLQGVIDTPTGPYLDLRLMLPYRTSAKDFQ